jgi:hypothetical protein
VLSTDAPASGPDYLVSRFVSYFRGRGDCYGSAKGFCVKQALTEAVFCKHLTSSDPADHIGVYCMVGELCSWGCIDIDGKDFEFDWTRMFTLASNLHKVLSVKQVHAFIERSKNGYHVWVFPEQPLVPARAMRRALMAACKAVGYDPKEVNPKAEGPRPGTQGLGNFVRLPYGGALSPDWKPEQRYMVFDYEGDPQKPLLLREWLGMGPRRTPLDALESIAALWTPPPVAHHEVDFDAGLDIEPILPLLGNYITPIWRDGPKDGMDRSSTLARLAYLCAERGLTATQTFAVVRSADQRWGKFHDRADGQEQLARFIERAYG